MFEIEELPIQLLKCSFFRSLVSRVSMYMEDPILLIDFVDWVGSNQGTWQFFVLSLSL